MLTLILVLTVLTSGACLWFVLSQRAILRTFGNALLELEHQGYDLTAGLERARAATTELARAQETATSSQLAAQGEQVTGRLEALATELKGPLDSGQILVSQGVDRLTHRLGRLADGVVELEYRLQQSQDALHTNLTEQIMGLRSWLETERDRLTTEAHEQVEAVRGLVGAAPEPVLADGVGDLEAKLQAVGASQYEALLSQSTAQHAEVLARLERESTQRTEQWVWDAGRVEYLSNLIHENTAPLVADQRAMAETLNRLVAGVDEVQRMVVESAASHQDAITGLRGMVEAQPTPVPATPAPVKFTLPQGLIEAAARRGVEAGEFQRMAEQAFRELVTPG